MDDKFIIFLANEGALYDYIHYRIEHIKMYHFSYILLYIDLNGAFTWKNTKQGRIYWKNLYNKWLKYEQEFK